MLNAASCAEGLSALLHCDDDDEMAQEQHVQFAL